MLNAVTRILTCPFKLHFGILLHIHGLAADKYKFFEKMERHDAADKKQLGAHRERWKDNSCFGGFCNFLGQQTPSYSEEESQLPCKLKSVS